MPTKTKAAQRPVALHTPRRPAPPRPSKTAAKAKPAAAKTKTKPAAKQLQPGTGFKAAASSAKPVEVSPQPRLAHATATAGSNVPLHEHYAGKYAYRAFRDGLETQLALLEQRFGGEAWALVGVATPFGTLIENAQALTGARVAGVSVNLQGTIATPMTDADLTPFDGIIESVRDGKEHGIDPIWVASVRDANGIVSEVNLTLSRGVRADPKTVDPKMLSGTEATAMADRRKTAFAEFKNTHGKDTPKSPPWAYSDSIGSRLAKLPPPLRAKVEDYRVRLAELLTGDRPGTGFLQRDARDHAPRPLHWVSREEYRPLIEEAQRMLYDTTGPHGANMWLVNLATELVLDMHDKGELRWGTRNIHLMDAHENFPFVEGRDEKGNVALPTMNIDVADLPLVPHQTLLDLVDRRIKEYGFDSHVKDVKATLSKSKIPGLAVELTPGARRLAALFATNLDAGTETFREMTRNGVLFTDPYFQVKPHGQYSHIFQWLYMGDRMAHPEKNAFGRNMHDIFIDELPSELMMEGATGVLVTDHVGQRAPQNPDHWNNTLKLIFRTDEPLREG